MKPGATFDSSFWVHAVYLDLLGFLFDDYDLFCALAVEKEIGGANSTALRLKSSIREERVRRTKARKETLMLYGEGERAAMNLALERRLILLIDDWKPYRAALESGIEVVNTPVYVVRLYRQKRVGDERGLELLAKLAKRGTIKPEWITAALDMVALYREEQKKDEKDKE
jgi:predicted nucleic acid-binding protein